MAEQGSLKDQLRALGEVLDEERAKAKVQKVYSLLLFTKSDEQKTEQKKFLLIWLWSFAEMVVKNAGPAKRGQNIAERPFSK